MACVTHRLANGELHTAIDYACPGVVHLCGWSSNTHGWFRALCDYDADGYVLAWGAPRRASWISM